MKKILQLLLLVNLFNTGFAQDYEFEKINMGINFDNREYISNILYGDEDFLYVITSSNGFIAGTDNEHYFSKIDLKAKKSTVLATIDGKENYFDNNSRFGFELDGVVYFFYSELNFDSDVNELFVYSYDLSTNKLEAKGEKICTFSIKEGGKKNNGSFDYYVNKSANSFSIIGFHPCPNAIVPTLIEFDPVVNKVDIWIFNKGLDGPLKSSVVLDSKAGFQCDDFLVTSDNTFYGLFAEVTKTAYAAYPELTYLVKVAGDEQDKIRLGESEDLRVRDASLLYMEGKMIVAGSYLMSGNKNKDRGLITFTVDKNNSVAENTYSYWDLSKMSNALSDNSTIESGKEVNFTIHHRELLPLGDKEFCLVVNGYDIDRFVRGTVVTTFNLDGGLKWQRVAPTVYGGFMLRSSVFEAEIIDGKILVYLNDRGGNFEVNSLEKEDIVKNGDLEFGYLSFNQGTGDVTKKSIGDIMVNLDPNIIYNNPKYLIGTQIVSKEEKLILVFRK